MGKLTSEGRALTTVALLLLGAGAFFGNGAMLAAGALPLLLVAGAAASAPRVKVTRTVSADRVHRGDEVEVVLDVDAPRGRGLLEVHQPLPAPFALADGDDGNFRLVRARLTGSRRHRLAFRAVAAKRGDHAVEPATVRLVDPLGLVEHAPVRVTDATHLRVLPRASHRRVVRDAPAKATRPLPEGDDAHFGLPTTDFRELREYVPGDPMRVINWKATARRMSTGAGNEILVNEYEHEGKKTVWIVVDGSTALEIGDSVEDAREDAVDAALGLAEALTRRGYQIGFATFRAKNPTLIHAKSGGGQLTRIRESLLALAPSGNGPDLRAVLDRAAPRLAVTQPLMVVFTRLDAADDALLDGLKRARSLQGSRPKGPSAVIVDLEPWSRYPDAPGRDAALEERRARHRVGKRRARAAGAHVLEWDPGERAFDSIVTRKGAVARS